MKESSSIQFSYQWESLQLADGSIFFDSTLSDHRSIANPPFLLIQIIRILGLRRMIVRELLAELDLVGSSITVERLSHILQPLIHAKIISCEDEENLKDSLPMVTDRFKAQIEWLAIATGSREAARRSFVSMGKAKVLVVGLGGLGSLLAKSLAAAGVGYLRLVDGDEVEESNLNRQLFYSEKDIGHSKVEKLTRSIQEFNSSVDIDPINKFVESLEDLSEMIRGMDVVALCADAPRFKIERWTDSACKNAGVSYVLAHAGVAGPMYIPGEPGCFECLESVYRMELGEEKHNQIVEALSQARAWQYQSFVGGPLYMAGILSHEIVSYLGKTRKPFLSGNVAEVRHPEIHLRPIKTPADCSCIKGPTQNLADLDKGSSVSW